jgi:hypothetical protein
MLVSICGMPRSGSTFSFNIVREILSRRGTTHWEASDETEVVLLASQDKNVIVKGHIPNQFGQRLLQTGAMKGVCTIRDPYDAIESWMDCFGFSLEESVAQFQNWAKVFNKVKEDTLVIRFTDIEERPATVIWRIARHLDIFLTPLEWIKIHRKYRKAASLALSKQISIDGEAVRDLGFSFYDTTTFFHRRHIRETKLVSLSESQKKYVRENIKDFHLPL